MLEQDRADPVDERRLPELADRDVDGDERQHDPFVLPGAELAACLAQHPFADRLDEPRFLRQVDELGRLADLAVGDLPAQQCLGAGDAAAAKVELRLVPQRELVSLDGPAKLALEADPRERRDVHPLLEIHVAPAAALLRAVHRRVGIAQQLFGARAVRGIERDADARVQELFLAADHERRGHRFDDVLRDRLRVARRLDLRQHDREFVAAEARHRVGLADALLQTLGGLAQHVVAGLVAERVVDALEVIEIDDEQRELARLAVGLREAARELVHEVLAVRQRGQRVVVGAHVELLVLGGGRERHADAVAEVSRASPLLVAQQGRGCGNRGPRCPRRRSATRWAARAAMPRPASRPARDRASPPARGRARARPDRRAARRCPRARRRSARARDRRLRAGRACRSAPWRAHCGRRSRC